MSPPLAPATALRHRPGVVHRELEGEAVLLDPQAGLYFGLNEVGTRAWSLLGDGANLGAIHEVLVSEYDAPAERVWDDLLALIRDLLAHRLLEIIETAEISGASDNSDG